MSVQLQGNKVVCLCVFDTGGAMTTAPIHFLPGTTELRTHYKDVCIR